MAVIGNVANALLGRFQHDGAAFCSMVAQNKVEAFAFLTLALTAGFVEEFVFRGYIQRQCHALCGNTVSASILQWTIFTQGHLYQGWLRLVPALLIAIVLTMVALWRKSLVPGMIAHGVGDGLVALIFFFQVRQRPLVGQSRPELAEGSVRPTRALGGFFRGGAVLQTACKERCRK
jgi:membrane protease YdiL (CAAX protease family)